MPGCPQNAPEALLWAVHRTQEENEATLSPGRESQWLFCPENFAAEWEKFYS
jgi:hypothetical protein